MVPYRILITPSFIFSLFLCSTYLPVQCRYCKDEVGRSYVTTRPEYDNLRGLFTFAVARIKIYEIALPEAPENFDTELTNQEAPNVFLNPNDDLFQELKAEIDALRLEIGKVQKFCLYLAQEARVKPVDGKVASANNHTTSS